MTNGAFPVPSATVEAGLLHSCITKEQWFQIQFLEEDDFSTYREVFRFFRQYLEQYDAIPSSGTVAAKFNWQPPIGDFNYWVSEIKRLSLARKVLSAIQDGYNAIANPELALNLLLERMSLIRSAQSNHIQATDATASERLERFDFRTENIFNSNQVLGCRTGMKIYDDTLVGWIPGSLVGTYARPGVGKTWWLIWQLLLSWLDGKTVILCSPEMPANMLGLRVDVVAGFLLGIPLDYNKLLVGDPSIRESYSRVTEILSQSQRWWTYDSLNDRPLSIPDVSMLIRQHKPEILGIDGISLLKSSINGPLWEQMKDLCYGAKNLATIHELPILMTHQASNTGRGRRTEVSLPGRGDDFYMPSLNDAAYGDSFVSACSDIITMCGDPTSSHINWYSIRKSRERGWSSPQPARMAFATDFAHGAIHDLSQHGFSPETVGMEVRRLFGQL